MEPISTGPVQSERTVNETEGDQARDSCLRNSVIVRKILEDFSNPEVLKLSFVNKLWNYEARSVIRKRSSTIARLHSKGPCYDIQAFAASLRNMKIIPFCGISMMLSDKDESCECETAAVDLTDLIDFDSLPFKTLSVQLAPKRRSPGCFVAKRILQIVSGVLEELTLKMPYPVEEMSIQDYVQECTFPHLRVLKLEPSDCWQTPSKDFVSYVKVLISRAPNLKELHSDRLLSPRVLSDLVDGSSVVHIGSYEVCFPFDQISEDVMNSAVRLQRMSLVCSVIVAGSRFDFDRIYRILPTLLQSTCTRTLCDVTVDALLTVPFTCYGIRLENVKKLTMNINHCEFERLKQYRMLQIIKGFDFTRIFPNLTKVHITNGDVPSPLPVGFEEFIEQANVSEPNPDRAVNIKELHLCEVVLDSLNAQFFADMFPNIERLYVERFDREDFFIFEQICLRWVSLKELHVKAHVLQDTANFDCVFCGIFFDEVVQLMQKDEEYLKRVNIVPVKPSITCLKNLRVLNLEYDLRRRPEPMIYDVANPMFFLSKITGLTAFSRCPNLAVNLKISPDGAQAVNHLKSFVRSVL